MSLYPSDSSHHRTGSDASMKDVHEHYASLTSFETMDDLLPAETASSDGRSSSTSDSDGPQAHRHTDAGSDQAGAESFGSPKVSARESPRLQGVQHANSAFLVPSPLSATFPSSVTKALSLSPSSAFVHPSATLSSAGSSGHSPTPTPPPAAQSPPSYPFSTSAPAYYSTANSPHLLHHHHHPPPQSYLDPGHATAPRIIRSSTYPAAYLSKAPALTLSLAQHIQADMEQSGSGGGYGGRRNELRGKDSPQPPSLSPMTISTPAFGYGGPITMGYHGEGTAGGTPITPISPFSFPHSSPASYGSSESGAQQLEHFSNFLEQQNSDYQQRIPPSPTKRQSYTSHPEEGARTKLKRSHSSTHVSAESSPESGGSSYLGMVGGRPSIAGPMTEFEAAGTAAAAAAAKTGAGAGAFVYKVYHMLVDPSSQHLISFNKPGTSFLVHNTIQFASELLPKHFKHSNFSSFVRQLNMYGFHKVNKTPRGRDKAATDTQTWEFTHPKFVRGRPQQLEEIRRKPSDSESGAPPRMTRSTSSSDTSKQEVSPAFPQLANKSSTPLLRQSFTTGDIQSLSQLEEPKTARPRSVSANETSSPVVSNFGGDVAGGSLQFPGGPSGPSGASRPPPPTHQRALSLASVRGHPPVPAQRQMRPANAYPSPNSMHHASLIPLQPSAIPHSELPGPYQQQRIPVEIPVRVVPRYQPPPPPPAHLPMAQRVEILELQRMELASALAGTQEGYEILHRELVEGKRRQDALLDVVANMYQVLQGTHGAQMPYHFPSHLFTPRPHDSSLATAAPPVEAGTERHHQRAPSTTQPHHPEQQWDTGSYQTTPPLDAPHLTSGLYHSSQETLFLPNHQRDDSQSSLGGKGYHAPSHSVDAQAAGVLHNLSTSATLAPPPSPVTRFSNAVNTPLPHSPHRGMPNSQQQSIIGLGLGHAEDGGMYHSQYDSGGQFYERLGLQDPLPTSSNDDVEMAASSLVSYAVHDTPRSPPSGSMRQRAGGRYPYGTARARRSEVQPHAEYTPYSGDPYGKGAPHEHGESI